MNNKNGINNDIDLQVLSAIHKYYEHKNMIEDVTIEKVFERVDIQNTEIMFVLRRTVNNQFKGLYNLHFDFNHKFKQSIKNLISCKTDIIYFTYGMQNIDFFRNGTLFIIQHSPIDGVYNNFAITKKELERLLKILKF